MSPATRGETELAVLVRDMRPRLEDEVLLYSISLSFIFFIINICRCLCSCPCPPRTPRRPRCPRRRCWRWRSGRVAPSWCRGPGWRPSATSTPTPAGAPVATLIYAYLHTFPCRRISLEIHSSLDAVGMSKFQSSYSNIYISSSSSQFSICLAFNLQTL